MKKMYHMQISDFPVHTCGCAVRGAGSRVEKTGEPCHPDVCLVRSVRNQIHRLKVVAKHDGEGTLVWVDAGNLAVLEGLGRLATPHLLDLEYWN